LPTASAISGAHLYDHAGGFVAAVLGTRAVYAIILPNLLVAPKRPTSIADGPTV
jgi:hypothetical protein